MDFKLRPTEEMIVHESFGAVRLWRGTTPKGRPICAIVVAIMCHPNDSVAREELEECMGGPVEVDVGIVPAPEKKGRRVH